MTAEQHACEIRKLSERILRYLAAQEYGKIVKLLDDINGHTYDIQTGK